MKKIFTALSLFFVVMLFSTQSRACVAGAVTGPSAVCMGSTITLHDTSAGGSWSSSNTGIATIASTGIVTPVAPGVTVITYSLPAGCSATTTITVGALPVALSGRSNVCLGSTMTLTETTAGGVWSSSNPAVLTVDSTTGLLTAVGIGDATIFYTVHGCATSKDEVVNLALSPIDSPSTPLCPRDQVLLTDLTTGGRWTSANPGIAAVGSASGNVTGISAGVAIITYTIDTGCYLTTTITVNFGPAAVTGSSSICKGSVTTFADATAGGVWSSANTGIATISTTGDIAGVGGGLDTVYYTWPATGCRSSHLLNVIEVDTIAGPDHLCAWGDTVTLTDAYPGGLYASSLVSVSNLGGGAGRVLANAPGIATITYFIPAGCSVTKTITINTLPALISGTFHVCAGFSTLFADTSSAGIWSSRDTTVATAAAGGIITGVAPGIAHIVYTLPTGCSTDTTLTVIVPPAVITGSPAVCAGASAILADSVSGGSWSSSATGIATIGATTGIISGLRAGTTTITYSLGGACVTTRVITVNALPAIFPVSGGGGYCAGSTGVHILLDSSQVGVSYQLFVGTTPVDTAMPGSASAIDFGVVTGTGTYTIKALNTSTSCTSVMSGSTMVSANPLPALFPLTGGGSYCSGAGGAPLGLGGSQVGINYQLYYNGIPAGGPAPGSGVPLTFGLHTPPGTYTVKATNGTTGCSSVMPDSEIISVVATVVPSVSAVSLTGDTVCPGVPLTFTGTAVNGGVSPIFQWKVNGVNTGTGLASYSYIPSNGDLVTVLLTSSVPCAVPDTVTSSPITITIAPVSIPTVVVTASPGTAIDPGQRDTLTAAVTGISGGTTTYQWKINGITILGATSSTYSSNTLANGDTLTCFVTVTGGPCGPETGKSSVVITINNHTGIANVSGVYSLRVMPNPAKNSFALEGALQVMTGKEVVLSLTDMLGREVYKSVVIANNGYVNERIATDALPNGMYLLNVKGEGISQVLRVGVEH